MSDWNVLLDPTYDWARNHSYVALDVPTWQEAEMWVQRFGDAVTGYKVGLELFHGSGSAYVERLVAAGKRIFLDVKLHDIPNTVAGALRVIRGLGVHMVNVHAAGGVRMLSAARAAVGDGPEAPLLIAVTVLTSLNNDAMAELGLPAPIELVPRFAKLAEQSGLDGVVASAVDVPLIYEHLPSSFVTVVPGTRPRWAGMNDQQRTATPLEAVRAGASYLVIGRAVTSAEDPVGALGRVWDEMKQGNEETGGTI